MKVDSSKERASNSGAVDSGSTLKSNARLVPTIII